MSSHSLAPQEIPAGSATALWIRCNHIHIFFTRSSQSLICFGLPFLTRKTMVDVYGAELFGNSSIQPFSIKPVFCIRSMSCSSASVTTSALQPSQPNAPALPSRHVTESHLSFCRARSHSKTRIFVIFLVKLSCRIIRHIGYGNCTVILLPEQPVRRSDRIITVDSRAAVYLCMFLMYVSHFFMLQFPAK